MLDLTLQYAVGELGFFARGAMVAAFERAAFSQRVGVIGKPVKSTYGYHIILVEAKKAGGTLSLDEAREKIRETLVNEHAAEIVAAVSRLTNELSDNSKISVYPENIK